MDIKTKDEAVNLLKSIASALDQLTVQGKKNCYIVVACNSDIESVTNFLTRPDEKEKED